jgi:hypothetical protein
VEEDGEADLRYGGAAVSGKHEEKKNVLFCNVLTENRRINASVAVKYC